MATVYDIETPEGSWTVDELVPYALDCVQTWPGTKLAEIVRQWALMMRGDDAVAEAEDNADRLALRHELNDMQIRYTAVCQRLAALEAVVARLELASYSWYVYDRPMTPYVPTTPYASVTVAPAVRRNGLPVDPTSTLVSDG